MPNLLGMVDSKDFLVPRDASLPNDSADLDHIASSLATLVENSAKPGISQSEFKQKIDTIQHKVQQVQSKVEHNPSLMSLLQVNKNDNLSMTQKFNRLLLYPNPSKIQIAKSLRYHLNNII